jgi:trans-aconitate 2-methyltransferase
MDVWEPAQYGRFAAERSAPFFDLLALVRPLERMRVADLGCGTGELTAQMHEQLGAAFTLGIDTSSSMLAKASGTNTLHFEQGDIAAFEGTWDLIFSNAAIQWVPDHPALFARLSGALAPGGQLAVQMPANYDHPSHTVAASVAAEEPFATALAGFARTGSEVPVLAPEDYTTLLHRLGFAEQHVRMQVYAHVLGSRDDVVEWVRGTLLTAYRSRLSDEEYGRFVDRYRARLAEELPDDRPFLFPFKRILMWARRNEGGRHGGTTRG